MLVCQTIRNDLQPNIQLKGTTHLNLIERLTPLPKVVHPIGQILQQFFVTEWSVKWICYLQYFVSNLMQIRKDQDEKLKPNWWIDRRVFEPSQFIWRCFIQSVEHIITSQWRRSARPSFFLELNFLKIRFLLKARF